MDVMLDIETLSTRPWSVILTLGAVKFDPWADDVDQTRGLYIRPDVNEQLSMDRHVQDETVSWWATQTEEVREEALGEEGRTSVNDMLDQLNQTIFRQQQLIDALAREVNALRQQLPQDRNTGLQNLRDELPPHY